MNTVRIYQLEHLPPSLVRRMKQAQMEAAQVWNMCASLHQSARMAHATWPDRQELQRATKGRFALHSQSVQMVVHAFLANIETTRTLRAMYTRMRMKYPWRTKRFYPVHWPAQAVSKERGRVVLPTGRGHTSLVLPLDLPENSGACTLVWHRGFELHVCLDIPEPEQSPGTSRHQELHWSRTRNEQPVSSMQASAQAQGPSMEVQEMWLCGTSRRCRQHQYAPAGLRPAGDVSSFRHVSTPWPHEASSST